MPTYEYECPKCGIFEEFHSISTILDQCPTCGTNVKRLISQNNNIIFKGSGFHTTDYRSGDYKSKAATDSSGSSASTSAVKTENKAPESKTETKTVETSKAS